MRAIPWLFAFSPALRRHLWSPKTSTQAAQAAEQSFQSYNRVQLAGRLVADPDLRNTPSGKAVCRMRVATNDTREAQFHDVVAWESAGDSAAKSLRKGAAVIVEGRLQTAPGRPPMAQLAEQPRSLHRQ